MHIRMCDFLSQNATRRGERRKPLSHGKLLQWYRCRPLISFASKSGSRERDTCAGAITSWSKGRIGPHRPNHAVEQQHLCPSQRFIAEFPHKIQIHAVGRCLHHSDPSPNLFKSSVPQSAMTRPRARSDGVVRVALSRNRIKCRISSPGESDD